MNYKKKVKDISHLNAYNDFDVCIIGAGPSGITMAKNLVENGINTVILDSGTSLLNWAFNKKLKSLAAYDFSGNTDYPLTKTKARLIGGNSNFWTGRCERLAPSDFENHPYTPENNPWPVKYDEMEPYYYQAELLLNVRSGTPSKYAPPRKHPYPLPASTDISFLKDLMNRVGVTVDDSCTATPKRGFRFFKWQKEILPSFIDSKFLTIIQDATVTKLIPNDNGEITSAEVATLEDERKIVKAKIFIVSGGGIESPRILLLSKSDKYPNGIGNYFDRVGRGFNEHPAVNYYGKIPHEWGTIKPTNKIARSRQFYETFREEGLGSIMPVIRQAWLLPHHMVEFKLQNIGHNNAMPASRFTKATLYMGATIEQEILDTNRVTLSEKTKDIFGNPIAHLHFDLSEKDMILLDRCRDLIRGWFNKLGAVQVYEAEVTYSRHHQGTCSMGNDPRYSVVDKNLKVHDTKNLYVCGAEVFTTGGAMQPVLTITALALRLSEHIINNFKKNGIKTPAEQEITSK